MTAVSKLPKFIVSASPKGGVGKTTTATGLGLFLGNVQNKKVLLLDQDNIASLTNNLQGADVRYPHLSNITHLFKDPEEVGKILVSEISPNIHLIQGDSAISDVNRSNDLTLVTSLKDNLLNNVPGIETYDYVIIDTPAGNGNTLLAALICADVIYSAIDLDHNAIGALHELAKVLKPIRRNLNKQVQWAGFVINRIPKLVRMDGIKVPEAITDRKIYDELVNQFGDTALLGTIALRNAVKKSVSNGEWINGKDDSAQDAVNEFQDFCIKLLEKV